MIIIRLKGGMGNQMFQYAFAKSMAAKLQTTLEIDCSLLLDRARGDEHVYRDYDLTIFKLKETFTLNLFMLRLLFSLRSSKLGKLVRKVMATGLSYEKERHFHVDKDLIESPKDNTLYEGWWQSEQYFEPIKKDVRKAFTFRTPLLVISEAILSRIKSTNSVCLNVRRTDFLTTPELNATGREYFLNAANAMSGLVENPHFFVFSDDVVWCKENIILDHPVEIVEHDHKGHKFGNYLQLMKSCKHFIIPNSSFAWWAVWLNENPERKVIAPKNWFNGNKYDTSDLVPDDWIRM